jgi:iron complex transport system substrate-binding protein
MNRLKKIAILNLLTIVFTLNLFAQKETRVVFDSNNKEVSIPKEVERVAPMIGAFAQVTAMLGDQEKIVAAAPRLSKMFWKVFPKVKQKGNISGLSSFSIESLIASKVQVVYGPSSYFFDKQQIEQLNKAGIAVVTIDKFSTVEQLQNSIKIIGEILGGDAVRKAKEFNQYYTYNIDKILDKTKNIQNKKTVLPLSFYSGNFVTVNETDIGARYINIAGGELASKSYDLDSKGIMKMVNPEQVLIWNPDVIIANSILSKKEILKNPSFKTLKAVKNRQIYVVPSGVYLWSVRSAEGSLQPLWLAKVLYPKTFKEIDLKKELKSFYNTFYNYDLDKNEIEEILHTKENKLSY